MTASRAPWAAKAPNEKAAYVAGFVITMLCAVGILALLGMGCAVLIKMMWMYLIR